MKRVTILWLILIFLAGAGGFALGTSHNKPRLLLSRSMVNYLLFKKVNPETGDPTGKYEKIKHKLNKLDTNPNLPDEEDWFTYECNPAGSNNCTQVTLTYTESENLVVITMKQRI